MNSIKRSAVISLFLMFLMAACSGEKPADGGTLPGAPGDSATPVLSNEVTASPPSSAYQDRLYSFELGTTLEVAEIVLLDAPLWLTSDRVSKKVFGVPQSDSEQSKFRVEVTTADGNTTKLGPYSLAVFGDPLKKHQWHLANVGQSTFALAQGVSGADLNLTEAVKVGLVGKGVRIAMSDDGLEIGHEDLAANILLGASKNYDLPSPFLGDPTPASGSPTSAHGTAVAGIIGAVGWNGLGGRGVAPQSSLAGLNYLSSIQNTATTIDQASGLFDVFNYSYGAGGMVPGDAIGMSGHLQIASQVAYGRGGKGSIFVQSAGNDFSDLLLPRDGTYYDFNRPAFPRCIYANIKGTKFQCRVFGNANFNSLYETYPESIVVGAINAKGVRASYSNPGSNLWITAPGGEDGRADPAILTTDLQGCARGYSSVLFEPVNAFESSSTLNKNCNYLASMNGTSAAAPMITGIVALLLEANPALTWRDVKYILASTARVIDGESGSRDHPAPSLNLTSHIYEQGWVKNAAGFKFHNWYGFGLVDASAAIELAKRYVSPFGEYRSTALSVLGSLGDNWSYSSGAIQQAIPDHSALGTSSSIRVHHNYTVEAVQVRFLTDHSYFTDLGAELTSPSGTKSILLNINHGTLLNPSYVFNADAQLLSNAFYGEKSAGNWTLRLIDGASFATGSLLRWDLNIIGHVALKEGVVPPAPVSNLSYQPVFNSVSESPPLSWSGSPAPNLLRYEVSVGTSPGTTDVLSWRSAGVTTSMKISGLFLADGKRYFPNVRAVSGDEVASASESGPGWQVDVTPPIAATLDSLPENSVLSGNSVVLTGKCEAGAQPTVTVSSGLSVASLACSATGVLTITLDIVGAASKRSGIFTASVVVKDAAGNASSVTTRTMVYVNEKFNILAAGDYHVCAVASTGRVECWGLNDRGQLGDGTNMSKSQPTPVVGLSSGVLSIAAGSRHSCALLQEGTIRCWGYNSYGQLGNGTTTDASSPVAVSGISSATAVVAGSVSSCALLADGTVRCWGYNGQGELGTGNYLNSVLPQSVVGVSGIVSLAANRGEHVCALSASGGVSCWGFNQYGQLGNGSTFSATTAQPVIGLSTGVQSIVAGGFGSCAKLADGSVQCWGYNGYGQLGVGGTAPPISSPRPVTVMSNLRSIDLGDWHTCATSTAGASKCWGLNSYGMLGVGTRDGAYLIALNVLSRDVVFTRSGLTHTCALLVDGRVRCWGKMTDGQMGAGSFGGGTPSTDKQLVHALPSPVSSIAAGGFHSIALLSDGTIKSWGSSSSGQLGTELDAWGNWLGFDVPVTPFGSAISAISAGLYHSCSLDSGNLLWCWGNNSKGQLGVGTLSTAPAPQRVTGVSGTITQIATGGYHSCALTNGEEVYCWGDNSHGQLGDSTTTNRVSPVLVQASGSGVIKMGLGLLHTCFLYRSGAVRCVGSGDDGRLGDCNVTQHDFGSLFQTYADSGCSARISNAIDLGVGYYHSCVVLNTGAVKCWGRNSTGQLGDSTSISKGYAVQATALTTGNSSVVGGQWHSCALTTTGRVKCWGHNGYGQLGAGSTDYYYMSYLDSGGQLTVRSLSAGSTHNCVVSTTNEAYCWGSNSEGELGNAQAAQALPEEVLGLRLF